MVYAELGGKVRTYPVEQKQREKHEKDHWRLLYCTLDLAATQSYIDKKVIVTYQICQKKTKLKLCDEFQ